MTDSERSLSGFAVTVVNNTVRFHEVLSIQQDDEGSWAYTAHPSGQVSASFTAAEIGASSATLSDMATEAQQEINAELVARIARGVQEKALQSAAAGLQLLPAQLHNDAGAIGAAAFTMQRFAPTGKPT